MSGSRRLLHCLLILACCLLIGWGLHICSYDMRRGLAITAVATLAAAGNLWALIANIPLVTGRMRLAALGVTALLLVVVLVVWWNLSPRRAAESTGDPQLRMQFETARRSLPALAMSVAAFGLTVLALPRLKRANAAIAPSQG